MRFMIFHRSLFLCLHTHREQLLLACVFTFPIVELTATAIKKSILNESITINLLELAVTGLPFSGKSELLYHMLELSTSTTQARYCIEGPSPNVSGLDHYEAILCCNEVDKSHAWIESIMNDAEVHAVASVLTQSLARTHRSSLFPTDNSVPRDMEQMFVDTAVNDHFRTVFSHLKNLIIQLEREGSVEKLMNSSLTFINLVNVGVNKAVYEVLGILACHCNNFLLLNLLNLERDKPENFNKIPNLADPQLYGGRYKPRKDEEKFMKLHSAMQHYMHAACVAAGKGMSGKRDRVIMVGTHKDKLNQGQLKQTKKGLERIIMGYAEEVGIDETISPGIECINARESSDCKRVCDRVVELINCQKDFKYSIPLRYIFFQSYLHSTKKMFTSRTKLVNQAHKCGLTDEDQVEEFLNIFNDCGSLFYSPTGDFPFLREYIILNPYRFIGEIDKLYYIDMMTFNDKPELFEDFQNTRLGFISERLATYLWPEEGEDKMTLAHFLLKILQELKIIVSIDGILTKCDGGEITAIASKGQVCYFMPTLRPDFDRTETKGDSNSLFVVYNIAMLPFHLLADILLHLQNFFGRAITFDPKPYYNTICFKWHDFQQQQEANIVVRFGMEQVEISVQFLNHAPQMSTVTHLFSSLKTACIQIFHQISSRIAGFNYELAIVCPNSNKGPNQSDLTTPTSSSGCHFITFHPLVTREETICQSCMKVVSLDQLPWARLLWTRVAFQGPKSHILHPNGMNLEPWLSTELYNKLSENTLTNIVFLQTILLLNILPKFLKIWCVCRALNHFITLLGNLVLQMKSFSRSG